MNVPKVETIRFNESDAAAAETFSRLPSSQRFGLRGFPAPHQYIAAVKHLQGSSDERRWGRLPALAQRDWHVRGQTGCMFARLAARDAADLRWDTITVGDTPTHWDSTTLTQIESSVAEATRDPNVEVVSLLFPTITLASESEKAIRALVSGARFWLERDYIEKAVRKMHLRYPVTDTGIQSWVMAFSPLYFVPNTRRGPYFELAARVKPKPQEIFHRLNQDRDVAHLADVPLEMSDQHWENRWQSTLRRTRMILDGEPDDVSAAKATFTVPVTYLHD